MNILLSEQLKQLRKEKGNTQEELAVYLGITTQAVSKWEREEGYPDITLLPAIASYYNVSVDDLLGVGKIEREKRINEYSKKNTELFRDGKSGERVALMREANKEFPNDLFVLWELMYALLAEDRNGNADEIIEYGKRILDESTDHSLRCGAIQCLSFTYYYAKNDAEAAKKYAQMAPYYATTVNEMMPRFLEGNEAVKYCQTNIQSLVDMIGLNTNVMLQKGKYENKEKIKALKFVLDCYNLLYSDGKCGFYHIRISEIHRQSAKIYLNMGDTDLAIESLEKAAEHAILFDTLKEGKFTSFMVNKLNIDPLNAVKDHTENATGLLLKHINKEKYSSLHGDDRIANIIEKLTPFAVM